jgi:hypothetical protein
MMIVWSRSKKRKKLYNICRLGTLKIVELYTKFCCCRSLVQYKQMFERCIVVGSVIAGKFVLLDLCVRHGISPKVYLTELFNGWSDRFQRTSVRAEV